MTFALFYRPGFGGDGLRLCAFGLPRDVYRVATRLATDNGMRRVGIVLRHDSFARGRQDDSTPQHACRHHGGTWRSMAGPEREIVGVLSCYFRLSRSLGREPMALPIWSICSLSVNGNLKLGFLFSIVDFGFCPILHNVMCSLLSALRVILLVLLHQAIGRERKALNAGTGRSMPQ